MLKDFLKDIWHDDKSNLAEKVGMTLVSPFVVGVSKMLNGPQGGKIIEHVNKFQEKDDKLREEHPGRWASKKLAKGIAKGVLGVPFTDN